ncbi:MAG: hypothetical protein KGM99_02435 [Burkholderiales bacterium]|nr:hypothetical protein [Burkholderiales bacterium]
MQQAQAGSGYYLVSVYENAGEKTLDFKSWTSLNNNQSSTTAPEIGFGYMPDTRWYTELYGTWIRHGADHLQANSLTWQNDYLLTQGDYPFDLALHTHLEHYSDTSRGLGFEFGPALQTDVGRVQLNGNVFFERSYRSEQSSSMQMKYQWQAKYRWKPALAFGLQGFGELGTWNHWLPTARQSHRIGPVMSGDLPIADRQTLRYEIAWFSGKLSGHPAHVLSMRMQLAF